MQTMAAFATRNKPYVVVNSDPSGTRTRAEINPVTMTTANSQAAAVAYSLTIPWAATGSARQAIAARRA